MGEKVGFTNCVFEKLCFAENAIFIVFSAKHSFSKTRTVCWKNRNFMTNSGLFLNMKKWCFLGLFFSGFNVIVFLCLVKLQKSLKMLVFPSFGGVCGVGYSCLFGFGRFRCLVFLALFFFFVLVLLFWFALLLFCCWIVFGVGWCFFNIFLLFIFLCFFVFLFFVCFLFFGRV